MSGKLEIILQIKIKYCEENERKITGWKIYKFK